MEIKCNGYFKNPLRNETNSLFNHRKPTNSIPFSGLQVHHKSSEKSQVFLKKVVLFEYENWAIVFLELSTSFVINENRNQSSEDKYTQMKFVWKTWGIAYVFAKIANAYKKSIPQFKKKIKLIQNYIYPFDTEHEYSSLIRLNINEVIKGILFQRNIKGYKDFMIG